MTANRGIAAASALGAFLLNLLIEHALLTLPPQRVLVPGLADLHQAWNRGVSFSLFWQSGNKGGYVLMAALALLAALVGVLAWRATTRLSAAGFGLVMGGALGNLLDRARHGAVFDYLSLHLGATPLFICNFSDIAISAGVVLLAWDALRHP